MQNLFGKALAFGATALIAAALAFPAVAANPCSGEPDPFESAMEEVKEKAINPCAPAKIKAKSKARIVKKGKKANPRTPANPRAAKPANPCAKN
ncbi:MAG: hypothetical protein CO125_11675 [Hydrogenophilales bacterium CG_4_9_14_3_um_filter_59_35]|nr:MAG: hypothetical protein COW70_12810 [Hydrogenophilales bacterium CG18_big_fil_WC_8_21_14_2_50_58_12]PJB04384.1 MAG: hypothetical protein CO125_11675 [Hydrogenophilales bacterium CG_4_9_14_3_um_filter_59_35]